ncbi:EpsG family protein [Luteimonas sp. MC1572]|uniref:EpsG family protein n=1 Tax=Luteimonas sp. MC1572 TaxID=2799325 RepID=UPI0018F0EB08|nr:EpsG family protein [Luteimonas sp. MC1572]MBJ6983007.1 EpsG family protein [Luteimonas sp. MC1572]QQO04221.1 EpsG family protein [Luteimonas sp. MC1572]
MWPFWLMFLIPAFGVLVPRSLPARQARVMWWIVGLLFALMIGLRHEVGGDWFNYLPHFQHAADLSFAEAAAMGDPGHYVLNRFVAGLGGSIYTVNLIYGAVLMVGTVVFCRRQPNPWLALLVAVPYMLIVVGMGYTRQSVALGFALIGLVALGEHRVRTFVVLVALGALFHKSAVLLLPIAALASSRNRWLTAAMMLVSTGLMYYLLLADSAETLWANYVEADMQSQGGAIRVVMNALPAALMIVFRKQLAPELGERKLWVWVAIFALLCVPLVGIASTAVDRVALYLIPLQLYVFARLPRLATTTRARTAIVVGILGYYGVVQFVWLNFATHAPYWVPYQFMPLT